MVINHILHYEDAKAQTKRLWATDLFLTGLLYPLSSSSLLSKMEDLLIFKRKKKKNKSCFRPEINHGKFHPHQRMFWKHMRLEADDLILIPLSSQLFYSCHSAAMALDLPLICHPKLRSGSVCGL